MSYYLTKSNPNKWRTQDYLRSLGADVPGWWSDVCKDTKPGDTLFVGLAGNEAGIYAKAIISSEPYPDTPNQEYAIPPGSAKERLGAETESFENRIASPILEREMRTKAELRRVAAWLHCQGGVCHLTDEEGATLDRLF